MKAKKLRNSLSDSDLTIYLVVNNAPTCNLFLN